MTEETQDVSCPNSRVNEILAAYLQAVDAGNAPARQELLARHPELAAELQAFFADHDELDQIAAPPKLAPAESATRAGEPTLAPGETGVLCGAARVRYFGDYEILEEIARGGMGVVFKARQVSLNRIVALKMILAGQLASEADVRRFRSEAEAAGNLDHPNIVPIYEVNEDQGQHYFSMKFIEGASLAGHGEPGASATGGGASKEEQRKSAELLAKVARAVHYAHQRGILHRDLKPANILVDSRGEPHVTDFGLAKRVESGGDLTPSRAVVGTPGYMPPEQAAGTKGLTVTADVYSLGAILYELLTGRPPFRAATPLDTLMQVLEKEPDRPRQVNPQVDRDLETICLKCLDKDPPRRYASAEALAEDLVRWLAGEPILARPTGRWERAVKWARRRPAISALVAVSTVSAICLLILSGFLWHNAEVRAETVQDLQQARQEMRTAKDTAVAQQKLAADKRAEVNDLKAIADRERLRANEAKLLAQRTLYAADMQLARAAWANDSVSGLLGLLKRQPAELRAFEWNYLWRLAHRERYTLNIPRLAADDPALAGSVSPSHLRILTGTARATFTHPQPAIVAVSADGNTLATARATEPIRLWDLATGKQRKTLAAPGGRVAALSFAPDGKNVWAVTLKDPSTGVQQAALEAVMTGKAKPSLQPLLSVFALQKVPMDGGAVTTAAMDTDHMKTPVSVYAGGSQGMAALISAFIPLTENRLFSPMAATASPDGTLLALGGMVTFRPPPMKPEQMKQLGAILLWDAAANRERALLLGHNGPLMTVAFSPDGRTLASSGFDKTIKLWDVGAGRERATLRGHAAPVAAFAFSADSKRLASGATDGIIKVWDAAAGQLDFSCKGHVQPVISLAWTPDGHSLVSGSVEGLVKVWDLATVQGPPTFKDYDAPVTRLAFTSGGAAMAGIDQKGTLLIRDVATGAIRNRQHLKVEFGMASCAALSPDGRTVAVGGFTESAALYDATTGQRRVSLTRTGGMVRALAFAPDGKTLAAATGKGRQSGTIKLWDAVTGKERHTLAGYKGSVDALAWSADGKVLAGGAWDGTVKLWDPETGKEQLSFHAGRGGKTLDWSLSGGGGVRAVAFSPDGRHLAVAAGPMITLHDPTTGKVQVTMNGYAHEPDSLAFSRDGRRLASGGGEGELGRGGGVKIWDTNTGLEVLSLGDPSDLVLAVAFSPDGGRLATSAVVGSGVLFLTQTPGQVTLWDGRAVK